MKKVLLTTLLLGSMAAGAYAETSEIDFTYAEGELAAYGKGKKESIDVAMCINDPSLTGMKVTGIKAYINTIDGLSETSVWLSSDLVIENKVNVADIASYDVTPQSATYAEYEVAVLAAELDEPYTLTGEPLYVGYSMTVDDVTTNGQKYPIIYTVQDANPNGLFLHMSKTVLKWRDYSETVGGVALIVVSLEGDLPEYSLGVVDYDSVYASDGDEFSVDFTVSNIGGNAINNVAYTYSVDGGAAQEGYAEFPIPVQPSLATTSQISLVFNGIEGTGAHDMEVTFTEVNGQPNESLAATSMVRVNVIPFVPVHRPLVEEYTGTWCGWCTRGFLAMELIKEYYDADEVSVCFHNGDPMTVTNVYPMNISGFPSASIDRISVLDPFYGSYSSKEFGIGQDLLDRMAEFTIAEIDVTAELEGNEVNAEASVRFIQDVDDANYQIGYILICNGLTDPSWGQQNYYASYAGQYNGSLLEELTTWPAVVYDLVFDDVAVDVKAMSGVSGSIPSTIKTAETYTNTISFDIENNNLVQNVNNLVVAAFIIDKNNGRIVNANKFNLNGENGGDDEPGDNGVDGIMNDADVVSSKYFDLSGRTVVNPSNGVYVLREVMSNGKVRTSKVMINN